MNANLLIIDPQNDFCDPRGSLNVPGADMDIKRLAEMIRANREHIKQIDVTLDSHNWIHIAHPIFWQNKDGNAPEPFTVIEVKDVEGAVPKWKPRNSQYQAYAINYVKKLEENDRYQLTIWPPHCLIGTWGHNIFPPLIDALFYYEATFSEVQFHFKGINRLTEHYSAIKAEVVDPEDTSTQVSQQLLSIFENGECIMIAGEALSHCVANTLRDVIAVLGSKIAFKCIVLEDASSNVRGFENFGENFKSQMKELGVTFSTTKEAFSH